MSEPLPPQPENDAGLTPDDPPQDGITQKPDTDGGDDDGD